MLDNTSQKIYGFALKKLGANDIPEKQLTEKLREKFITKAKEQDLEKIQEISDKIFEIIELLKSQKYIDDIRFCENFIRWRKEAMPRGKYMIIQELIRKKINNETATELCDKHISYNDELKMCNILFIKKYETLQQKYHANTEYSSNEIQNIIKQKLFSFLAGKQFSYALITEIWDKKK